MTTTERVEPHPTDDPAERPAIGVRAPLSHGITRREEFGCSLDEREAARTAELLRVAFNGGPAWFAYGGDPVDHLLWKARDCPFSTRVTFLERDDELLGFGWVIHRRYLIGGVECSLSDGGDSTNHPSLQGLGIYRQLNHMRRHWRSLPDVDISMGVSTHPAILHVESDDDRRPRLGNNILTLFRPLDLGRLHLLSGYRDDVDGPSNTSMAIDFRRRRLPRPMWARRLIWWARQSRNQLVHPGHRRQLKPDWSIDTVTAFDSRIDAFFDEAASAFDLIQVRDATYLNWRFCDPRSGPFVVRVAEQDGRILGYCVLLTLESRPAIVDLLVLPGRIDVARSLVEDALAEFRRRGAPAVTVRTVQRHPYNELLRRLGFLPRRAVAVAAFRPMGIGEDTAALLRDPVCRVHLMYADTDHV